MKKAFLIMLLILSGCDSTDNNIDIQYALTGTGTADVWVYGEEEERIEADDATGGWTYDMQAEEGSQLLYIRLANVRGQVGATITAGGEVLASITATEAYTRGVSAWGSDTVTLHYTAVTEGEGSATFSTPSGNESLASAQFAQQEGPAWIDRRTLSAPAGFQAQVVATVDDGDFTCTSARIEFEPMPGKRLDLVNVRQCGPAPVSASASAEVP